MEPHQTHVMTTANSIIGVSILAMPFCFKQCGIILSIVLLFVSSIISRLSCHFLLKSAIIARLRTFEFLAYHAFGSFGKFVIEVGLIGFLMGTCIAFFVVMGELAPGIVAEMTNLQADSTLRTAVLMLIAFFCVLPLGLLRKVDSLSAVSTATICFYVTLVLKVVFESLPHILQGDWIDKVELWKPSGILQCLPIFSMALFCQTQLFEIYQAIPNASLEKMNNLIRAATNICISVYILVGVFGYIALSHQTTFTGNILLSLQPSIMTDVMKIGFVLSVAFSFPLIIFPCRASLYSLLYKRVHDGSNNYIPERKFKILTVLIVGTSLLVGVLIPNIELVLGLVGSTIGVMICVIFPATCFICIISKNTNERLLAQLMLFIGIIVMVLGTYANMYAFEEVSQTISTEKPNVAQTNFLYKKGDLVDKKLNLLQIPTTIKTVSDLPLAKLEPKQVRHEPPQPEEPMEMPAVKQIQNAIEEKPNESPPVEQQKEESKFILPVDNDMIPKAVTEKLVEVVVLNLTDEKNKLIKTDNNEGGRIVQKESEDAKVEEPPTEAAKKTRNENVLSADPGKQANSVKVEEVDIEAIKKEDKEIQEVLKQNDDKDKNLLNNEVREQLNEFQKQIDEIKTKQEKESADNKKKLIAFKEIEKLAKKAIETLTNDEGGQPAKDADKRSKDTKQAKALVKEEAKNDIKILLKAEMVNQPSLTNLVQEPKKNGNLQRSTFVHNAEPLSYKLGLNKVKNVAEDPKIYVKEMIPIPLVGTNYSRSFLKNNSADQSQRISQEVEKPFVKENVEIPIADKAKESSVRLTDKDGNLLQKTGSENDKDDIQSIRRDILSNDRQKREVDEDESICEKNPGGIPK